MVGGGYVLPSVRQQASEVFYYCKHKRYFQTLHRPSASYTTLVCFYFFFFLSACSLPFLLPPSSSGPSSSIQDLFTFLFEPASIFFFF